VLIYFSVFISINISNQFRVYCKQYDESCATLTAYLKRRQKVDLAPPGSLMRRHLSIQPVPIISYGSTTDLYLEIFLNIDQWVALQAVHGASLLSSYFITEL